MKPFVRSLYADREPPASMPSARRVEELETRLDRALLVCEALWTLLRERFNLTDEQLADRVNQLDLSDGQLDGKVRKPALSCPSCMRTIAARFTRCSTAASLSCMIRLRRTYPESRAAGSRP